MTATIALVAVLFPAQATSAAPAVPSSADAIHLVVDRSGSMAGNKLAEAKAGVMELADAAGAGTALGLRSYEGACSQPPSPQVPVAVDNVSAVKSAAQTLVAAGSSPTSAALQRAIDDLGDFDTTGDKVLVLVTDGDNGCPTSICDVARQAVSAGVDLRMFTVGLQVSSAATADLTCAAEATEGSHFTSFDDLLQALGYGPGVMPPNETFTGQPFGHFGPGNHPTQHYEADPVSTSTGNFLLQRDDVTVLGGRGVPAAFSRSYNSLAAGQNGPLGYGWTHAWAIRIDDAGTGAVDVVWGDGRLDRYQAATGPGAFTAPPDIDHTLTRTVDGFALTVDDNDDVLRFDTTGRLVSVTDRSGNTTTLGYTGALLSSVTDPSGRTLFFGHGSNGRIATVTDAIGQVWSYRYNAAGDLVEVENPADEIWAYGYDSGHRLVSIVDPDGTPVVTNTYVSSSGRVASQVDGEDGLWQYDYLDGATVVTDPTGVRYTTHHDQNFRTIAVVDDEGHETRWHHDASGNLRGTSDPAGGIQTFQYDAEGQLIEARDPHGYRARFSYDADGNLTEAVNAVGGVTTNEYDALGRLVRATTPTGEVTEITYRDDGLVDTLRDARGGTVQHHYDANGLQTGTTDPLGRTVTMQPRLDGLLTATVDAAGAAATRTYDEANRLTAVTDPNGSTVAWAYDGRGNVVAQTDANGNTTTHSYDGRGIRIATTDPLGRTTTHSYDAAGRPTATTDGRGVTVSRSYDNMGRLVRTHAPDVDDTVVTYDDANRPLSTTDAAGTVTYDYDRSGRVVAEHHSRGDATVRYRWDPLGRPAVIEMDRAGTLVASTAYGYDAAGRPVEVIDAGGGVTRISYDELGLRSRLVHANGTVTSYTHDVAGQLTGISNLPPAYTDLVGETDGPLQNTIDTADALHKLVTQLGEDDNLDAVVTLGTTLQGLVTNLLTGGIVSRPALLQLVGDLADVVESTGDAVDAVADDETLAELERLVDELGQLVHSVPATAGTDPLTDLVEDLTDLAESVTSTVVGLRNELTTLTRLTADAVRLVQALLSGEDLAPDADPLVELDVLLAQLPEDITRLGDVVEDTVEVLIDVLGAAGALQSEHTYSYDVNGRVTAATRSFVGLGDEILRFHSGYRYDPGGRLVAAATTDPAAAAFGNATYRYDPAGNRTSVAIAGLLPVTATFDAAGQRIADTLGRYTYDGAGNMTSRSLLGATETATTYQWDAHGRLAGTNDGNISVRNQYDHTGRRTRTEVTPRSGQPSVTDSFYAGWDLLFSDGPSGDGALGDVAYTTLDGTVLNALYGTRLLDQSFLFDSGRQLNTALRTHLHTDVTGNVTEVSDGLGNAVVRNAYGPWGDSVSLLSDLDPTGGALLEHGYAGGLGVRATPTGDLLDMRHRTYDPTLGQFLSRDPLEDVTGEPYAYASNDPVNMIDPWGLCSVGPVRIGFMSRDDGGCKGAEGARQAASTVGHAAASIGTGAAVVGAIGVCGATVVCAVGAGLGGVGLAAAGHAGVDRMTGSRMRQPWEYFAEGALDAGGGVVCAVTFGATCVAKAGFSTGQALRNPVQHVGGLVRTLPRNEPLLMAGALGVGRTGVREVLFGSGQRGPLARGSVGK